ncbi:RNA-binding protein 44-like [Rhinatrema bivittatum]|uniref:RNA-binding protein 44-like n=1 Tax=Rhinatrema bivittatum TaxID=194408 RepID=UPI00112ABE93|nr:RNA-binding protein 44-like [Rhinatrema bivittatum]XP_029462284.1 RNA-binding protein 44-like [Rhinatrema bivittatum]
MNMEQTYNIKEISRTCKVDKQCFEAKECYNMDSLPKNLQRKAGTYVSEQAYSRIQLMLAEEGPPLIDEALDTEFKIHRRHRDKHVSISQDKNRGEADSIEVVDNNVILKYIPSKEEKIKYYEDLELKYQSTKQYNPSGKTSAQEEIGIPDTEVIKMIATVYETVNNETRCSLNHDYHLGDASIASGYDLVKGLNETNVMSASSSVQELKQSKDTISLKKYKDLNFRNVGEKQVHTYVLIPDHTRYVISPANRVSSCSVCPKILLEHDPENQQVIDEDTSVYNTDLMSQIMENKEFAVDTLDLNNNMLQMYEDSHVLKEQKETMESIEFHSDDLEDSSTDISDDSFYTVSSNNNSDSSLQSDTLLNFVELAEVSANENQCLCREALGGEAIVNTFDTADCITTEFKCLACLSKAASNIKMTVNQSVDATSDFRIYFTTNRATNVETLMVSRGNNTELSFANKFMAKGWQHESYRSVGSNTDNYYVRSNVQEVGSQTIWVGAWGNHVADLREVNSTSLMQDSLKLRIDNVGIELTKLAERNFTNKKTELSSSLLTSLAVLEARYKDMKEKLLRGTPLEALPPLLMESKMKTDAASCIPSMMTCSSDNFQPNQNVSNMVIQRDLYCKNEKKDVMFESSINEPKEEYYVHVGSLHPSVSEAEVRSLFQRYDVTEVLVHEYSMKKSFAFLTFKTARHAKMAVEEMDGKEIHGKNIKVRLIKVAREPMSSTLRVFPNLLSPDRQVIFGENIEKKASSRSPELPVSNLKSMAVVDFVPNLVTVHSSDPNDSTVTVSDLQTETVSTTNMIRWKATTPWAIANSTLPINPSTPFKAMPNSSLPTKAIPNSSLPSNCSRAPWAIPNSSVFSLDSAQYRPRLLADPKFLPTLLVGEQFFSVFMDTLLSPGTLGNALLISISMVSALLISNALAHALLIPGSLANTLLIPCYMASFQFYEIT